MGRDSSSVVTVNMNSSKSKPLSEAKSYCFPRRRLSGDGKGVDLVSKEGLRRVELSRRHPHAPMVPLHDVSLVPA